MRLQGVKMDFAIITFTLGLQVGVFIGILWEQRQRRLFREMVREKLSKSEGCTAWNIAEDLEINLELSEGYDDGKKKESNNS